MKIPFYYAALQFIEFCLSLATVTKLQMFTAVYSHCRVTFLNVVWQWFLKPVAVHMTLTDIEEHSLRLDTVLDSTMYNRITDGNVTDKIFAVQVRLHLQFFTQISGVFWCSTIIDFNSWNCRHLKAVITSRHLKTVILENQKVYRVTKRILFSNELKRQPSLKVLWKKNFQGRKALAC